MKTWNLKDSYLIIKKGEKYRWFGFGPGNRSLGGRAWLEKKLRLLILSPWKFADCKTSNDELKELIEKSPEWSTRKTPAIKNPDFGNPIIMGDIPDKVMYSLGYEKER